jgi:hypothetical protein
LVIGGDLKLVQQIISQFIIKDDLSSIINTSVDDELSTPLKKKRKKKYLSAQSWPASHNNFPLFLAFY